jgi:RNA polymerase sigma factor (sigma-70 family)
VEASALRAPALARRPLATPLLRLRSDDQLIALFRAGSDEAFSAIHERYRQRLFAYVRQMLAAGPRADAEDVLQDVFVRAYGSLRRDARHINLRAWLYRVAHNRCIDHLRRPVPPAAEVFELSRTPLQDPIETAQRRDDLRRLVADVGRLPEQQRSALLMREIDGLAYADIAGVLDVTVPAVKSLLVRARVGLVESIEARDTDCAVIRGDLLDAYDRGVKASSRARRHMRECAGCRDYRTALRGMRRSFAALTPVGAAGPLALAAQALGLGGTGGGGAAAAGGTIAAGKVAAVVCTAALATGGVAEVRHLTRHHPAPPAPRSTAPATPAAAPAVRHHTAAPVPSAPTVAQRRTVHRAVVTPQRQSVAPAAPPATPRETTVEQTVTIPGNGGSVAPDSADEATVVVDPAAEVPADEGLGTNPPADEDAEPAVTPSGGPPPEH